MRPPLSLRNVALRGAASSLVLRVGGSVLTLAISVFFGRVLGAEQYGIYAYALTIVGVLAMPFSIGIPDFLSRQFAIYHAETRGSILRGLFNISYALAFGGAVVLGFSGIVIASVLFDSSTEQYATFIFSIALLPLLALNAVSSAFLRGLNRILASQLSEFVLQPALFLGALIYFSVYLTALNAEVAMVLRVLSFAFAVAVTILLLYVYFPFKNDGCMPEYSFREWLLPSSSFLLVGGLLFVHNQIDIIMLGIFEPSSSVGIYKIAVIAATLVGFILQAVNTAIGPIIARLTKEGKLQELQDITTVSTRIVFVGGLAISAPLILFGGPILESVYGKEFISGARPMAILCIGQIVNISCGAVLLLMNMAGFEVLSIRVLAASAVFNIALNAVLIPLIGIDGAAFSTAATMVVTNVWLAVLVRTKVGVNSTIFRRGF